MPVMTRSAPVTASTNVITFVMPSSDFAIGSGGAGIASTSVTGLRKARGVVSPMRPKVVTTSQYWPAATPPVTAANLHVARWPLETETTSAVASSAWDFLSTSFADSPGASSVTPLPVMMNSSVPRISPMRIVATSVTFETLIIEVSSLASTL